MSKNSTHDPEAEVDPFGPENRCRDFDDDCRSVFEAGSPTTCWLHDPTRGWCPYLLGGMN